MIETTEAYGFNFAYPAGDSAVGRCLRDYGEFGRVGSTLCAQLSRGAGFLDVGANIGAYALPAAREAREVIAVEAQPLIAGLLRENVAANSITNVRVVSAAAGEVAGEMEFPTPSLDATGNFGAVGLGRTRGPMTRVPVIVLDDLAAADTRIVKIDVEGYEPHVLRGAPRLLRELRPFWLVEVASDTPGARSVIDGFRAEGYRNYWFYDPFVTPRAPRGTWDPAGPGDLSVLAAPAEAKQPVGMVEVGATYSWPTTVAGFNYLRAFGFG